MGREYRVKIKKKDNGDIASCGLCFARNYVSEYETGGKVVDEIFEFRFGNVVHFLCKDCFLEMVAYLNEMAKEATK